MSEITIIVSPGHVAMSGEIDLANAEQVDAALSALAGDLTVDCTELTFIGATGFHALDRGYRAALARRSEFVVSGMSAFQRRLAAIVALPYVV